MSEKLERQIADAYGDQVVRAKPEVLQRILERRAGGERVTLGEAPRPSLWPYGLIAAGLAAMLFLIPGGPAVETQPESRQGRISQMAEQMLMPGQLVAQGSVHPSFSPVSEGLELSPGEWTYTWLNAGGLPADSSMKYRIRQQPTTYGEKPAWLLLSRAGPLDSLNRFGDSTWIDDASSRLLARSFRVSGNGRITEEYREHEMLQGFTIGGSTSWKVISLDTTDQVYNGYTLPTSIVSMVVRRAPLKAGWTGSVPIHGLPSDSRMVVRWYDLAVVGETRVSVPAGEFDCWKVRLGPERGDPESGFFFYVSKDRHWLVQEGLERVGPQKRYWKSVLISGKED